MARISEQEYIDSAEALLAEGLTDQLTELHDLYTAQPKAEPMSPLLAAPLEAMQAFNNAAFGLVDFVGTDTVNALLNVAGSDTRIPRITDQPLMNQEFMEEGLGRDISRSVGEAASLAVGAGQLIRKGAENLPKITSNAESTIKGLLRQQSKTTPKQDLKVGALSGAGMELGGATGEMIGGPEGRLAGETLGSMMLPLAAPTLSTDRARALYNSARGPLPKNDIVEAGKQADIPIMTTDAYPPKTFKGKSLQQMTENLPFIGTAGKRAQQQEARKDAVDDFTGKFAEFSYDEIVNSLKSTSNRVKRSAGSVIGKSGEKLDDVAMQQGDTVPNTLTEYNMPNKQAIQGVPLPKTMAAFGSAKKEFSKSEIMQSQNAVKELDRLTGVLSQPRPTTAKNKADQREDFTEFGGEFVKRGTSPSFTALKQNRTAFRELVDGIDSAEKSELPSFAKGVLRNVEKAMGADMNDFAKANLPLKEYTKYKRANEVYFDEATKLKDNKFRAIFNAADTTPEKVKTLLFSKNETDVTRLYKGLNKKGKNNVKAAIIDRVVTDLGDKITPTAFANKLQKMKFQTNVFFKGDDKKILDGLIKAINATNRAQQTAAFPPTGQTLTAGLAVAGAFTMPLKAVIASGVSGTFARMYETPIARNALIRLNAAKANSPEFEKAFLDVQRSLSTLMNSAKENAALFEPETDEETN